MESKTSIELCDWQTCLSGKELYVLSVGYSQDNEFGIGIERDKHYLIDNSHFSNPPLTDLLVRVFAVELEEVYQIRFFNTGGFRVVDEHGLQEIVTQNIPSSFPTLKIRHHGWSKESPVSFFMGTKDGWSYLLMTGWDCIEILTESLPEIILERKVEPQEGPLPDNISP